MDADNTLTDKQPSVTLSFLLQIPKGNAFEVKVEQGQFSFYLNEIVVEQIQQAQKAGYSLYIPPRLLLPLWYYACFNDNQETRLEVILKRLRLRLFYIIFIVKVINLFLSKSSNKPIFQSGITFDSYYSQSPINGYKEPNIVLRSLISIDGDIIHKVRKDLLRSPNCIAITSAHYWLTNQLLNYLRTNLNQLASKVALFFPVGLLITNPNSELKIPLISLPIAQELVIWLILAIVYYRSMNQLQNLFTVVHRNWLNWIAFIQLLLPTILILVGVTGVLQHWVATAKPIWMCFLAWLGATALLGTILATINYWLTNHFKRNLAVSFNTSEEIAWIIVLLPLNTIQFFNFDYKSVSDGEVLKLLLLLFQLWLSLWGRQVLTWLSSQFLRCVLPRVGKYILSLLLSL